MVKPTFLQGLLLLFRSAGVGIVATLVDLGVLALLVSGLGVPVRAASIPALTLGIAVQFFGNKLFAFGDRSNAWLRQGAQFLGVEALGFIANLMLFDFIVSHTELPYLAVRLVTTAVVYYAVCLPLWTRIFKPELEETTS